MTEKEYREYNKIRRKLNKQKRPKCKKCKHGKPYHGYKTCIYSIIKSKKCGCKGYKLLT